MFAPVSWFGSEALVDPGTYTFNSWDNDIQATGQNDQGCVTSCYVYGSDGTVQPPATLEFFRGNGGQPPGASYSTFGNYTPPDTDPDIEIRWSWTVQVNNIDPPGGPMSPSQFNEGGGFTGANGQWVAMGPFGLNIQFGINGGSIPSGSIANYRVVANLSIRNTVTGRIGTSPSITFRGSATNGPPF